MRPKGSARGTASRFPGGRWLVLDMDLSPAARAATVEVGLVLGWGEALFCFAFVGGPGLAREAGRFGVLALGETGTG